MPPKNDNTRRQLNIARASGTQGGGNQKRLPPRSLHFDHTHAASTKEKTKRKQLRPNTGKLAGHGEGRGAIFVKKRGRSAKLTSRRAAEQQWRASGSRERRKEGETGPLEK